MTESASEDELRGRAGLVSGVNFLLNRRDTTALRNRFVKVEVAVLGPRP